MKISILCCLTVTIFTVNRVNCAENNNGFQLPTLQLPSLGLSIPSASPIVPTRNFGFPRKPLPFLPVPVVKKVTHHHIHHVIAHKGVVKSKYSDGKDGFDLDNKDSDKKKSNTLDYKSYKNEMGLKGDFNDNGFRSSFHKRGGQQQQIGTQHLGDLIASSTAPHRGGIRGFIGGQKAEFVPLIIGIIDDSGDLITGLDSNKQFSSRKGLIGSDGNKRQYIPSKETLKLFEDLAKLGFK